MRKNWWRISSGLVLVALFAGHAAEYFRLPLLQQLESMVYDMCVRVLAPHTPDERIVVVDIDEKSLREKDQGGEGHWPWRRDRLALLLTNLFQKYGVSLVAMDIILSEKSASSELDTLEYLKEHELKAIPEFAVALENLRPKLLFDQLLGQAMQGGPVVLGYAFHNDTPALDTRLPEGLDLSALGLTHQPAQSYPAYAGLLPELQTKAAGAGHLNHLQDDDGVTRRVPLLIEHKGLYYPSLALAAVQTLTKAPLLEVQPGKVRVGPIEVPVDRALNAVVPFRGLERSFTYLSAVDVLNGRVPVEQLKDRIVLIGASAAGLGDIVTTSMGVSIPGVEVHANLIAGMLDGRIFHRPVYVELLSVIVLGFLMVFVGVWFKPAYTVFALASILVGLLALSMFMLWTEHLMLPVATSIACLSSLFFFQMGYAYLIEARGKRQISKLFANYVPPELVEKMAENPGVFNMAPVERELTVLFSDVRDFTSISERLSPDVLAELINAYLTAMSEVIRDCHHGTLDKYIGDAVMAFWGAPLPDAEHAQDAVLAALRMQHEIKLLNQQFMTKGWPTLKIGIGLNTGLMRVGDMGSKIRRAYTVMGDAVNLGSRLEGLTKVYGVEILIGENTRDQLHDWICREVDEVRVKGKDQHVGIYEPIGRTHEVSDALKQELWQWDHALAAYRSRRWEEAQAWLSELRDAHPASRLYALYVKRIEEFQIDPPPLDWDVTTNF
ncbi:MAG: adenylate/guanylate cyclase domain-containing protein [Comamonadaceae bacterium]